MTTSTASLPTAAEIKNKITTDPRWASRAILALYARQTSDEQSSESTNHLNGTGFTGADAGFLSSLAKQLLAGRTLSQKQLTYAFKYLGKYAGQLARIAANTQTVPATFIQ